MLLTGEDDRAIHYSLLKYASDDWVRVDDAGEIVLATVKAAVAVLKDLGFKVLRFTGPTATVEEWAAWSEGKTDPLLLFTEKHALVVCNGQICDNPYPAGILLSEYPRSQEQVHTALQALPRG